MEVVHVNPLSRVQSALGMLVLLGLQGKLVGGALVASASKHSVDVQGRRIWPPLVPKSDSHFFKHDYPHDERPEMEDKWRRSFPLVQGTKDYDKDFVKDENYDGGFWHLQNEYDSLRGRLTAAREARSKAEEKVKVTEREMEIAREQESDARQKAQGALEAKTKAELEAREVLWRAEHRLRVAQQSSGISDEAEVQEKTVEQETEELEECKRQLAAARARLKSLQDEKASAEDRVKEYAAQEQAAEAKQLEKEQAEAALKEKVDKATKKYDTAHRQYLQAQAETETTERNLAESEAELRRYRHPDAHEKGSSVMTRPSFSATLATWTITVLTLAKFVI